MPAALIEHIEDPYDTIIKNVGDLSKVEVFNNQVLVAVYQRPSETKTRGGILLTHKTTDEDRYQSKVGMILKMGHRAFVDNNDPPTWFIDQDMYDGDWVIYRPSSGWALTLISEDPKTGEKREQLCRMVEDVAILGRIDHTAGPDRIY